MKNYVLIDDDVISNMLSRMAIQTVYPNAKILEFTNPLLGIEHLLSAAIDGVGDGTVLFLDINMPELTGWELLDRLESTKLLDKAALKVYILSSSVNTSDLEKAKNHPYVLGFVEKPLTSEIMNTLK